MLKKYRRWIYGIGVLVIVATFYLLVMGYGSSGTFWVVHQIQRNLEVWAFITVVTTVLMASVAYLTRSRK